jgi:hypothetical protein
MKIFASNNGCFESVYCRTNSYASKININTINKKDYEIFYLNNHIVKINVYSYSDIEYNYDMNYEVDYILLVPENEEEYNMLDSKLNIHQVEKHIELLFLHPEVYNFSNSTSKFIELKEKTMKGFLRGMSDDIDLINAFAKLEMNEKINVIAGCYKSFNQLTIAENIRSLKVKINELEKNISTTDFTNKTPLKDIKLSYIVSYRYKLYVLKYIARNYC